MSDELNFMSLDLTQVTEGEFDNTPIPPGEYLVKVDKVALSAGKESGTPYLKWQLQIIDGDSSRKRLFENTMLAGKGAFRTKQILKGLGYSDAEIATFKFASTGVVTDDNRRKGIPVTLQIGGSDVELTDRQLRVAVKITKSPGYDDRNEVSSFMIAS